jgi:hypothetical protein
VTSFYKLLDDEIDSCEHNVHAVVPCSFAEVEVRETNANNNRNVKADMFSVHGKSSGRTKPPCTPKDVPKQHLIDMFSAFTAGL